MTLGLTVVRLLLPRVGVDGGERECLAFVFVLINTGRVEVDTVDENLELASFTERTEEPSAMVGPAPSARPAQVRRAGVNKTKRVVTGVVKAGGNGVRWKLSHLSVLERSGHGVDVNLERVFADLNQ